MRHISIHDHCLVHCLMSGELHSETNDEREKRERVSERTEVFVNDCDVSCVCVCVCHDKVTVYVCVTRCLQVLALLFFPQVIIY